MAIKYFELGKDEKQILKNYEQGGFKPVADFKRVQKQYRLNAKDALEKSKNINIRISENDLLKIKSLAARKGLPYQTLLSSLVHQYSTGQIEYRILQ